MNHISQLLLTVLLLSCTQLSALTYYVSNNGNDANSGLSSSEAFLTIQKGADVAVAGDTVWVADGTYAGFDFRNKNGTAADPVVFKATGPNALINQSGPIRNDGINIENADYVVVDGFIVNDMTGNGNGIRVAFALVAIYRPRLFEAWWLLDYFITALVIAWLAAFQWVVMCWVMGKVGK